jgi:hypothetical protein
VFPAVLQEHGQAGAEAARAFHRPNSTTRHRRTSKAQEVLVAGRVGAGGDLSEHAADLGDRGSGQGVAVGVDADDAVNELCQHGHAVVLLGEGGRGRRRPGRSHRAA